MFSEIDARRLLSAFEARGIALRTDGDRLVVKPASKLSDADREAIRAAKAQLLAAQRRVGQPDDLPLGLEAITDAIAASPRSPALNALALSRAARCTIEATRGMRELSGEPEAAGSALLEKALQSAASAIERRDYVEAFELLDNLPTKIRALRPN